MNKKIAYVSTILLASILVSSCSKYPKVEEKTSPEFEKVLSLFKDEMPTEELSSSMKARIDELDKKCKANDDESCMKLADIYSSNHLAQRDIQKAVNIWVDQCQKDNHKACRRLYVNKALFQGKNLELVNSVYDKSASSLKEKCESGNSPDSCYKLASYDLFKEKSDIAFEKIKNSCENGSVLACSELSDSWSITWLSRILKYDDKLAKHYKELYKKGIKKQCESGYDNYCLDSYMEEYKDESSSEKKNLVMSKIQARCQNGDERSCTFEGEMHFVEDFPNDNDIKEGLTLLNKACDSNIIPACTFLSDLYKQGKKIEKDEKLSLTYLEKACNIGDSDSCKDLAKFYRGDVEHQENKSKVIEYIELAVERSSSFSSIVTDLFGRNESNVKERIPLLKKGCLLDKYAYDCLSLADDLYLNGNGDKKNANKVIALNEYACSSNWSSGCVNLSKIYTEGKFVTKDLDKSFEFSKKTCEQDALSCLIEAKEYLTSISYGNREKNDKKANELLEINCSSDFPKSEACRILAENNEKGIGTSVDFDKANRLYSKACNADNLPDGKACFYLGENYESGLGVEENIQKANEYYRKSCEIGNFYGCVSFAYNRENGIGFELNQQNKDASEELYKLICSNDSYPQDSCGLMYDNFLKMNKKHSKEKAIRIITALCETGTNNVACFQSGLEFGNGEHVKADPIKSNYYYKKGCYADKDYDTGSCTNYGYNLSKGIGVKKDMTKAVEVYKRACSVKDPESISCSNIASAYMNGDGVAVNYSKSIEYAKLGCENNSGYSCGLLTYYSLFGIGTKLDYKEALSYGEKGCDLNDSSSCNMLGLAYDEGKGVKQNYGKAKEYYGKGCDLGFQKACDNYARVNKILQGVR